MAVALGNQGIGPTSTPVTAVIPLVIRNIHRAFLQLRPGSDFSVLANPMVVPGFLSR